MLMGPHLCVVCKKNPVFANASEKLRFQELQRTVQDFQMPRRCWQCRREARKPVGANVELGPAVMAHPAASASRVIELTPKRESPEEEIRLILATKDFEDLVHGRPVVWQGVRVILADIGFKVMKDAVERAETARAREAFHRNGSI